MDKIKEFFKKKTGLVILGIIVIFIGAIIYAKQQPTMTLFYSDSCPHCKNVEAYINENGIKDKIKFDEKEVSGSQANATILERKARQCGLDLNQGIGVPFFFDGKDCLMGDQPIIDYFKALN
jgi:glutaredoxin